MNSRFRPRSKSSPSPSPFVCRRGCHGNLNREAWLTGKAGAELLQSAPNDLLRMWPVSKRVNVSGRGDDDPSLIKPVEDEAIAGGLDIQSST
jgi:hypothetical protein